MARKETIAQKRSRIAALLADYDATTREANKLSARVKELKDEIRELEPGTYNECTLAFGTPRMILDQAGAKRALIDAGIGVPMAQTQPPIVVTIKH